MEEQSVTIWRQHGFEYVMQAPFELQNTKLTDGWTTYAQIIHHGIIQNLYFSRRFTTEQDLYAYCKEQHVKIYYLDKDDNVKREFN